MLDKAKLLKYFDIPLDERNNLNKEEQKSSSVVDVSRHKFKSEKEVQLEKFERAFGKRFNWQDSYSMSTI